MEIKFRGLRKDGKGWIIGNLFVPNQLVKGVYICETTTFADFAPSFEEGDDIEEVMSHGCALGRFIEVKPETVGQFTGLTDKNGKEIYSGDIVRLPYQDILEENGIGYITAIVTFEKGSFRCREIQFDYDGRKVLPMTLFEFIEGDEIEVVGNIFENSELLNK